MELKGPSVELESIDIAALLAAAPDYLVIIDDELRFRWVNRIDPGLQSSDVLGRSVVEWVAPEDAERVTATLQGMFATGEPVRYTVHSVLPENRHLHYDVEGAPVPGRTDRAILSARDITEYTDAIGALRASRERERILLEVAPDVILLVSREGKALAASRTVARRLNMEPEQLVGSDVFAGMLDEETAAARRRMLDTVLQRKRTLEYREVSRGRQYHSLLTPVLDQNGEVEQIAIYARDITERLATEHALEESRALVQQLAETMPNAFWIVEVETGRVLYANPALEGVFGVSCAELLADPMSIETRLVEEDRPLMREAYAAVVSGKSWRDVLELRTRHRIGDEPRWIELRLYPIVNADGAVARLIHLAIDITQRKETAAELEAQRRRLAQAEKLEAIGRLAGGVAHDFNNMLTAIMGAASFARQRLASNVDIDGELSLILEASSRAKNLTAELLAFGRREFLSPRQISIGRVVRRQSHLLCRTIGEHVQLDIHDENPSALVNLDPTKLEQIVTNLVLNARDALPNGGTIRLSVREVALGNHPTLAPGSYVQLRISDNGSGMSEAVRARIFEPFFTTKPEGQGTGLGLASVYGLVQQSGGAIFVDSQLGEGTTFDLYFSAVVDDAPADSRPKKAAAPGGDETVLVVEDDLLVREIAVAALVHAGYTVLEAADGAAVKALEETQQSIDLALVDVVLPGDNGLLVAEQLRRRWPAIKILHTSGYSRGVVHACSGEQPISELLPKPYTSETLMEAIRRMLDGATQPSAE